MKIGNKVKTKHGEGVIVGYDLPKSDFKGVKRLIVRIDKENGEPIVKSMFPNNKLCYFLHEVVDVITL